MSHYLFVQSQDGFTETRTAQQFQLAGQLQEAGHNVSLVLVQNGVTQARAGARTEHFDRLLAQGVRVIADEFSLRQREIGADDLKPDIAVGDVDVIIDALLAKHKVIWN